MTSLASMPATLKALPTIRPPTSASHVQRAVQNASTRTLAHHAKRALSLMRWVSVSLSAQELSSLSLMNAMLASTSAILVTLKATVPSAQKATDRAMVHWATTFLPVHLFPSSACSEPTSMIEGSVLSVPKDVEGVLVLEWRTVKLSVMINALTALLRLTCVRNVQMTRSYFLILLNARARIHAQEMERVTTETMASALTASKDVLLVRITIPVPRAKKDTR